MITKIFKFADRLIDEQFSELVTWSKSPRSDRFMITPDGGYAIRMTNGTGAASVKGTLLSSSTTADNEVVLQANEYDTVGVCYEDGIDAGDKVWLVVAGRAQYLLKNTVSTTRGGIMIAADTDGRAGWIANPGSGLPAAETHFKECGHCTESKTGGTDVLVWGIVHFN